MPTLTNIMQILNNMLTKYYNNIQQIYCDVTGVAPPQINKRGRQNDNTNV